MRSARNAPLPVLLLTLALAASPALAAGGRSPQTHRTPGIFATVWPPAEVCGTFPGTIG